MSEKRKERSARFEVRLKASFVRAVEKHGVGRFEDELKTAARNYEEARKRFCAAPPHTTEYDDTLAAADEAAFALRAAAAAYGFARTLNEKCAKRVK